MRVRAFWGGVLLLGCGESGPLESADMPMGGTGGGVGAAAGSGTGGAAGAATGGSAGSAGGTEASDIAYRQCGVGHACGPSDRCERQEWEWSMECTCDEDSHLYVCTENRTSPAHAPKSCQPADCTTAMYTHCAIEEPGCNYSVTCNRNEITIEGSCPRADENP